MKGKEAPCAFNTILSMDHPTNVQYAQSLGWQIKQSPKGIVYVDDLGRTITSVIAAVEHTMYGRALKLETPGGNFW